MNARFNEARQNESGFTLVELLVVIAIIAILTAIAVPAFLNQRQKANDAAVRSDVKNVVTQIETGLVDMDGAIAVSTASGKANITIGGNAAVPGGMTLTKGVTVTSTGGTVNAYTVTGYHSNGGKYKSATAGQHLIYNSAAGGFTN